MVSQIKESALEAVLARLTVIDETEMASRYNYGYGCPECDGYGNVFGPEGVYSCACKMRYFAKRRLKNCGVPDGLRNKTVKSFATTEEWQRLIVIAATKYIETSAGDKRRNGLLFWGPPGTGKTHMAVAILLELVRRGERGKFLDYQDFLDRLRQAQNSKDPYAMDWFKDLTQQDIVLLDDFGAGRSTEWVLDEIRQMINRFYIREDKTLILTTNLDVPGGEISEIYGRSVESRLRSMCKMVPFNGKDFRL